MVRSTGLLISQALEYLTKDPHASASEVIVTWIYILYINIFKGEDIWWQGISQESEGTVIYDSLKKSASFVTVPMINKFWK
jgi:hypothetical protein